MERLSHLECDGQEYSSETWSTHGHQSGLFLGTTDSPSSYLSLEHTSDQYLTIEPHRNDGRLLDEYNRRVCSGGLHFLTWLRPDLRLLTEFEYCRHQFRLPNNFSPDDDGESGGRDGYDGHGLLPLRSDGTARLHHDPDP